MIPKHLQEPLFYGLALGVGLLALSIYLRGIQGTTKSIVSGTIGAADAVGAGVIKGIGEAVGIPDTNLGQCAIDMQNGDNWAASFSCPASTYLEWQRQGAIAKLDRLKDLL